MGDVISIEYFTSMLSAQPVFHWVPKQELNSFFLNGKIEKIQSGAMLFMEDQPCSGLFVLLEGAVQLCRSSSEGQLSILNVIMPVVIFNEVAVLDQGLNTVSAYAMKDSIVWHSNFKKARDFFMSHPNINWSLMSLLASRNRVLVNQLQNITFHPILTRTARLLLELSQNGEIEIDRRQFPSRQMAARVSTVPEAFCRSLKTLKEMKGVECSRAIIKVTRPEVLENLSFPN